MSWHHEVESLKELEQNHKTDDPWPQAIVFFTNRIISPWPSTAGGNATVLLTAINHPLFKTEELREAAERQYPEIGILFGAVNELRRPPQPLLCAMKRAQAVSATLLHGSAGWTQ
jgi:hypothetical protein